MPINTFIQPVYIINRYVYDLLRVNLPASAGWNRTNYGGMTPIVLSHQEPKIMAYNRPFIVYGYASDATSSDPVRSGSLAYTIWSTDTRLIGDMITIISEGLGRDDASARDVNNYSTNIPEFVGCRFLNINTPITEGVTPPAAEGGNQSGFVAIRFRCTADYSVNTAPTVG